MLFFIYAIIGMQVGEKKILRGFAPEDSRKLLPYMRTFEVMCEKGQSDYYKGANYYRLRATSK